MPQKRAHGEMFINAAISTVAEVGIENTRTKDVASCVGFSEATMYRMFPTKEILLREAFLYIDKKISDILIQNAYIIKPDDTPFELAVYDIWRKIYRYLIDHREETIFLIRYRYSSLYTDEIRSMRQAYNGNFDKAYEVFEHHFGKAHYSHRGFLINYLFEVTLCFVEKIITDKIKDAPETERGIWTVMSEILGVRALKQG